MFQAGGLVVVVVEIFRRNFLASMVPVIVNAILNEHQLVIDIVAFVIKGDFHRSRLGEKQRGKILAGWVTRKMRTIAQYAIRDVTGLDNHIAEEPAGGRPQTGTWKGSGPGSLKGGSLRASSTLGMTAMQNLSLQTSNAQEMSANQQQMSHMGGNFGPPLPAGVAEMPGERYPASIPELGPGSIGEKRDGSDDTPTEVKKGFPLGDDGPMHFSPIDATGTYPDDPSSGQQPHHQQYGATGLSTSPLPNLLRPGPAPQDDGPPAPQYGNKPYLNPQHDDVSPQEDDRWGYSPERQGGGGLRVANRDSSDETDNEWRREALMSMNFAGGGGPGEIGRYNG